MNKRLSKESGITLIELLAVLAIMSILISLMYGVLINGFDYSKKSNEKVAIQQEMNLLLTSITRLHEDEKAYFIFLNPDASSIQLQVKNQDDTAVIKSHTFSDSNFEYTLSDYKDTEKLFDPPKKIETKDPFYIKIIISSKRFPAEKYEVKTIISRL
jgi:prepilin-type N-terminal cleavage/methylation domain-containing protein